jgi:hypothetical protein
MASGCRRYRARVGSGGLAFFNRNWLLKKDTISHSEDCATNQKLPVRLFQPGERAPAQTKRPPEGGLSADHLRDSTGRSGREIICLLVAAISAKRTRSLNSFNCDILFGRSNLTRRENRFLLFWKSTFCPIATPSSRTKQPEVTSCL